MGDAVSHKCNFAIMLCASNFHFDAVSRESLTICAVSGKVPEEPVVSPAGVIFEKRLIATALADRAECPVTQQPLEEKDLIAIKLGKF